MFDAKSLLENLVKSAQSTSQQSTQNQGPDLSDLLGKLQSAGKDGAGGLADILGNLQSSGKEGAGGIADMLGNVFGQATQGVKEGAGKINEATGAGDALNDTVRQLTEQFAGKTPEEILAAAKEFMANNQLGTGAALGGLGALILGTSTGRSVAMGAAKIGALALISGLAYKAYQNYQEGKPLIEGDDSDMSTPPSGSGFEAEKISNDQAALYIKAMIAAAAADGRIDTAEHERIMGSMKQTDLDSQAEEFLAQQLNNPASIDDLASASGSKEEAVQIYTAARISINPDTGGESAFLAQLAQKLKIEPDLASHIDAAARNA